MTTPRIGIGRADGTTTFPNSRIFYTFARGGLVSAARSSFGGGGVGILAATFLYVDLICRCPGPAASALLHPPTKRL